MALQDILAELAVNLRLDTAAFSTGVDKATQKTSQLERRLDQFKEKAGGIGKVFAGMGGGLAAGFATGFGIEQLVHVTEAAIDYAGALAHTAQQLGVTTKDLQVFRFAAEQTGVGQEKLEVGLKKLSVAMGQAELGSTGQIKAFKAVGISIGDIRAAAGDGGVIFRKLADGLEKVTDRSQRAAVEAAIFGAKAGPQLDTLLTEGSKGLDEFARSAERLGIVLSDAQIAKMQDAKEKFEALKNVLSARIASAVADNVDSILSLANAIGRLVSTIPESISGLRRLWAEFKAGAPFLAMGPGGLALYAQAADNADQRFDADQRASAFRARLASSLEGKTKPAGDGVNLPQFLTPKGPKTKDPTAELLERLNRQKEIADRELKAQEDVLRAQQDLSDDYTERATIGVQILDLERKSYAQQLKFEVEENRISKGKKGITQAEADILLGLYDQKDALQRQNLTKQEELEREKEFNANQAEFYSLQQDRLKSEDSLAETAAERRRVELEILDLAYKEKKERLERVIRESKDPTEVDLAQRDLAAMPGQYQLDRKNTVKSTRGPLEDYLATLPTTAAKANEALQRVEVEGLQGLEDGLVAVITGTKSVAAAFKDMAKQIIGDLVRIGIERAIIAPLANAMFGPAPPVAGARAGGGPVLGGASYLVGERGPEIFTPSHSGRIISNRDSSAMLGGGRAVIQNWNVYANDADSFRRSEGQILRRQRRSLRS
jgi:hypothetical protein